MIARILKGVMFEPNFKDNQKFLEEYDLKSYKNIPGNKGVYFLQRNYNGNVEFLLISLWDSFDSIKKLGNIDYEGTIFSNEGNKYLLKFAPDILHYDITHTDIFKNKSSEFSWRMTGVII